MRTLTVPQVKMPISSGPLPPLHQSAYRGDREAVSRLLESDADPNAPGEEGTTALYWASSAGHLDVARVLIEWGADPNRAAERGETPLLVAVRGGHALVAGLLLRQGANTEITTTPKPEPPPTPEQEAASAAITEKFRQQRDEAQEQMRRRMERKMGKERADAFFAEQKQDVSRSVDEVRASLQAPRRQNLMMLAVRSGSVDTVRTLLEGGVPVTSDGIGVTEMSPLKMAQSLGQNDMVRLLLAARNRQEKENLLFMPVYHRDYEQVRFLLEAGADPNFAGETRSGMDLALLGRDVRMVDLLMDFGGRVDTGSQYSHFFNGDEVLRDLVRDRMGTDWIDAVECGDRETVRARLAAGTDPNTVRDDGETGLHLAAKRGDGNLITLLLTHRADPNQPAKFGHRPLHGVVKHDNAALARLLANAGADVNAQTDQGGTPLFISLQGDKPHAADALRAAGATETLAEMALAGDWAHIAQELERGTSPDAPNPAGATALMGAAARGNLPLLDWLRERGASLDARDTSGHTSLHQALRHDKPDAFHHLLEAGADASVRDNQGHSLLYEALMWNRLGLARTLLARGLPIAYEGNSYREHLLHWVLRFVSEGAMQTANLRLLLENGGDPNATGGDGETLLVAALQTKTWDTVLPLLLELGADINRADDNGQTPLGLATRRAEPGKVRFLLEQGADPNRRVQRASPLGLALALKNDAIAALLRESGAREPQADEELPPFIGGLLDPFASSGTSPLDRTARFRFALPGSAAKDETGKTDA